MTLPKFIITADEHKDLLKPGDQYIGSGYPLSL